ncbi:sulfate permease [Janibacter indicus]|uniref:Sulfate permease n=1 Tax=Janibacter indicus TaxID=857417 RepID=A0A1W2DFE4_9MICO|nr:sulfate permease [Janibacter indicus]SMC96231.1 hypothetical protein SAMN06296429_1195 [Janibacter indicus]
MFRLIWALSVRARYFLRRYMPTNILLDAIRTRRGLRWGLPAMLLAIPYLYTASICVQLIEDAGPGWLHLLVLLFIYNAMKFTIMGPVSLVLLLRAKVREHVERRREHRADHRSMVTA